MSSLTVITICHNALPDLKKSIASFLAQKIPSKEMLIIDGKSSDGTVDWLRQLEASNITYISEKDGGISDAFNKGVRLAKTEWVCFLNAGDTFISDDGLECIEKDLAKITQEDAVVLTYQAKTTPTNKVFPASVDTNTPEGRAMICHQASIMRRSAFESYGYFSNVFQLRMDYEFFLRVFRYSAPKFITRPIILYDVKGRSSKLSNRPRFVLEGLIAEYLTLKKSNAHLAKAFYLIPKDYLRKLVSYSLYWFKYRVNLF